MNPLKWLGRLLLSDDNRPPAPDQIVVLAQPAGEAIAGLWKETLEAEQIESMVRNVSSLAAYGVPQYELLVRYKDVDRARGVLHLDEEPDGGVQPE